MRPEIREARGEVPNLDGRALRVPQHGPQDGRVPVVGLLALGEVEEVDRERAVVPDLLFEERREHGIRVEARETGPDQTRAPIDQSCPGAVARRRRARERAFGSSISSENPYLRAMRNSAKQGRLVVASNRLPVTLRRSRGGLRAEPSSGGLVAAMAPAMQRNGGSWIGWPGARLNDGEQIEIADSEYDLRPIPLTPTEVKRFYHGYSNGVLWPLFHSLPERVHFGPRNWPAYQAVNERFAEALLDEAGDEDLIWVHDYHLALAPELIRRRRPTARIGFFLHVPFPPFDVYRILPQYREILRGMLACDFLGFHCPGYVTNFLDCVERLLGARVDRATGEVEHGSHLSRAAALPLGIDYAEYEKRAQEAPRPKRAPGEKIILGVDRLDYTKGIPERIRAYEQLLDRHPEFRTQLSFVQVAVPSREQVSEYQSLKREIDELVGRVNGRLSSGPAQSWRSSTSLSIGASIMRSTS